VTLPAFAAECGHLQPIYRSIAGTQHRQGTEQQTSHMLLLLLSIDGTDGRTDTYIDAVPRTVHAASIWLRISKTPLQLTSQQSFEF